MLLICHSDPISVRKCASFAKIIFAFLFVANKGLLADYYGNADTRLAGWVSCASESWVQGFTSGTATGSCLLKAQSWTYSWPGRFFSSIFLSSLTHGVEIRLRMVVGFLTTEPSHP